MRAHLLAGATALALLGLPGAAMAAEGTVQGGGAIGVGGPAPNSFAIDASGEGSSATGFVQFRDVANPAQMINGTVVCMQVESNRASVIYVDNPLNPASSGGVVRLQDGGFAMDTQRNGRLNPSQIAAQVSAECPLPDPFPTLNSLFGEIVIEETGGGVI